MRMVVSRTNHRDQVNIHIPPMAPQEHVQVLRSARRWLRYVFLDLRQEARTNQVKVYDYRLFRRRNSNWIATIGEWNDDIVDEIYVKVGDRYVLENDVTPEDAAELVEEIANEIMYDEAAEEYIKELTDETADGYDPDIAVAVTI